MGRAIILAALLATGLMLGTSAEAQSSRRSAWEPVSDPGGLTGPVGRWLDFYRAPYLPHRTGVPVQTPQRRRSGSSQQTQQTQPEPGTRFTLPKPTLPELQPTPQPVGAGASGAPGSVGTAPAPGGAGGAQGSPGTAGTR